MPDAAWPPSMQVKLGDRTGFPQLEARAYLAHCSISPASNAVREAARRVVDDYSRRGIGAFMTWHKRREGLRASLAELIGARPVDIGFVANTTTGVSTIALCFPWRAGDRVALFRGEFPTNVTPWQRAAELYGLELEYFDVADFFGPSGDGLAKLEASLVRGGLRLIAVSAVQFQSGLRMPVAAMAELAHRHGAELFCDAIQAVGALELDVRALGVDYLSAGSHKWLMGLEGCAMLYIAPERVASLRPNTAGWMSHEQPIDFLFGPDQLRYDRPLRRRADFTEAGAYSTTLLAALEASVGCLRALGAEAIETHLAAYLDPLEESLRARGFTSLRSELPEQRSGILSLRPPPSVTLASLQEGLDERGFIVTSPDGVLRFSPHWPNALAEVDTLLAAVDELT